MKFSLAVILSAVSSVATTARIGTTISLGKDLAADSELGMKVLSKARRLENEEAEAEEEENDITWVSGYSLKFQGCHHIRQVC